MALGPLLPIGVGTRSSTGKVASGTQKDLFKTLPVPPRRIYCSPSDLMVSSDRNLQFGMIFDESKPWFTVKRVEKGLAADAGIVAGDQIININGFNVRSQFGRAYRALCAPSLSATVLEIDRGGRRLMVKIPCDR
jgi:predicted metalloprotease with PDZ domain